MLPWIVGAVVVATLSSVLSEREKKEKNKRKRKLQKQHDIYSNSFQKKSAKQYGEKQKILFSQIKNEQAKLKKERKQLFNVLNRLARTSKEYRMVENQIFQLSHLIEKKQSDANKVRGNKCIY
ncbi:MAG TPA: hypothetical protein EYG70_04665 [Sulfurimonas sp.]|nr:hypothetical protein [Sulfurimonas sp.]